MATSKQETTNMDYFTLGMLIVRIGVEATNFIIEKQQAGATVTLEEWQQLLVLAGETPKSQLDKAIAKLGLSVEDPHVKAVLAMVK